MVVAQNTSSSEFIDRCMPFKVRTSCGHIVVRKMRSATAGVAFSDDVVLEAPNGAPCPACAAASSRSDADRDTKATGQRGSR